LAKTFLLYGRIYAENSEFESAKKSYEEALSYCDMSASDQSELKLEIYINLSGTETNFEELMYYFQEAEKLMDNRTDPNRIRFYYAKGNTYYSVGWAEEE